MSINDQEQLRGVRQPCAGGGGVPGHVRVRDPVLLPGLGPTGHTNGAVQECPPTRTDLRRTTSAQVGADGISQARPVGTLRRLENTVTLPFDGASAIPGPGLPAPGSRDSLLNAISSARAAAALRRPEVLHLSVEVGL